MYENEDADQLHGSRATFSSASFEGGGVATEIVGPLTRYDRSHNMQRIKKAVRMEKTINLILVTNIHQQAHASQ